MAGIRFSDTTPCVFQQRGTAPRFIMPSVRKGHATTVNVIFVCLPFSPALADAEYWGCGFKPTTLNAGPLTCHQTVECRSQSLTCKQGDRTLFVTDAFADHLAVSHKGQYIVGLSNRGMLPLFWLRNFDGEPINLTPVAGIQFCMMSVTNIRQWFDDKRPEVKFRFEGDKLSSVIVRGCAGNDVLFNVGE